MVNQTSQTACCGHAFHSVTTFKNMTTPPAYFQKDVVVCSCNTYAYLFHAGTINV